ncbi:hypothetical protein [Snuella lapsa]|uniref:GHKL domain-containing protein n=1 Tax=Snuella lapsa TaxID=870481 RepID=A0ABP6WYQ0_9FLAO
MITADLDYNIRKINSFILRGVLISLLLFNYLDSSFNYFQPRLYTIFIVVYVFGMLFQLYGLPIKYRGIFRYLLDISLITLFLYEKDLGNTLFFLPYILLLFNSINYSNSKSRTLVFILGIHLSILIVDGFSLVFRHQLIPVIFYVFMLIYYTRKIFNQFNSDLIKLIGDLFAQNISESSSYKILHEVKKRISRSSIGYFFKLDQIFLFRLINNRLVLIKGTQFIRELPDFSDEIIGKIKESKEKPIKGASVIINTIEYSNIYWQRTDFENSTYVYLICLKPATFMLQENIIIGLKPVFSQVSKVFHLMNSLDYIKKNSAKTIKEKVAYVLDAKNAMHFVKNKLTPITNILDLVDRYFKKPENLDERKEKYIKEKLKNNRGNVQIKEVISKAELMIKGVDNLIAKDDVKVSERVIIDSVRRHWFYHFENLDDVRLNFNKESNFNISFNHELFDFVFTDIIENISKYSTGIKMVEFIEDSPGTLTVLFKNEIKDYNRKIQELQELVTQYNQPDNDEIYSRKTHGLSFIRGLMKRKKIKNVISIERETKMFIFKITFISIKS